MEGFEGVKIANRAQATITALDAKGHGVLEFEDGRRVKWKASETPQVDYAYASGRKSAIIVQRDNQG
jgi:hypothetical protein